jgi:large subunit ribosomal protein L18e
MDIPKLRICALRFTEGARRRIEAAGGLATTFDQLAINRPDGKYVTLLRGNRSRETIKHFGRAPGLPGSTAK